MIRIIKTRGKIFFPAIAISLSFFLSGCLYSDQPRENVLRSAEEYGVRSYAERQPPENPSAARKLTVGIQESGSQKTTDSQRTGAPDSKQSPAMQIDESKTYSAVLKTGEGEITIDLDAKKTPKTVNNFVSLSREGFYNGTIFHRVVKDFMIQGGDPNGDGSGGPGYKFDDENLEEEYMRGTVAMANSGPNTNGSQFFIIHKDYDLSKSYVIFGHVSKGMEVVDKIAEGETVASGSGEKSKPVNPVKIESVEIVEK